MTTIYDAGGNYTKLIEQQHDEDNNLLSCPKCNSTHLIKGAKIQKHKDNHKDINAGFWTQNSHLKNV